MTEAKQTMTVWLVITDSECGTHAFAYLTARAAYAQYVKELDEYLDDDGAYTPHVELRATLQAALVAEDWKAIEAAFEKADEEADFGLIDGDTLYVTHQEVELPSAPMPESDGGRTVAGDAPVCDSCGLTHSTELDCTEVSEEQKEQVLDAAREAQDTFWSRLSDLEAVIGEDIDGTRDLNDETLESLLEEQE